MASRAEVSQNLPDTLPADFGDWDAPDVDPAPAPESAPPAPPQELVPAEARSQRFQAERGSAAHPVQFSERPRAFAAATPIAPRVPSSSASAYPVAGAYLRRLRSLNAVADRAPAPPAKAEPNAYTRAAELREIKQTAPEEASAVVPDDSHFRALFHSHGAVVVEEESEHGIGAKWKIIFAVATGSILLVAFQLFHSGVASRVGQIVEKQPIAIKVNTGFESAPASAATIAQAPKSASAAATKPSAATPQANAASPNQGPAAPDPAQARIMRDQLMAPTRIPQNARGTAPVDAPPGSVAGIEALNGGAVGNVFSGQARPNVKAVLQQPVAVSAGIATGMLIYQIPPVYPVIAKAARVSGTVVIQATIAKSGSVTNVRVVKGPAMLQQAALDAVKTWRYRPYKLNNEPTEVETTVNVNFTLGR